MHHQQGFTLLEMIIVLSVITLVFLLTLPNIQQKQQIIDDKGCEALVEVVNSQILLFRINTDSEVSDLQQLVDEGYLKTKQLQCPNGQTIGLSDGEATIQ
jgi:competence protein ComGC